MTDNTKKETICKVLKAHPCITAREISFFAKRMFNFDITPSSAGSQTKLLVAQRKVASSPNTQGTNVYWLIEDN